MLKHLALIWVVSLVSAQTFNQVLYYVPIGQSPVYVPGGGTTSLQPVDAPYCTNYATGGTEPTDQFEIFCRLTNPLSSNDLPQTIQQVIQQNNATSQDVAVDLSDTGPLTASQLSQRYTFAFWQCTELDNNWFNPSSCVSGGAWVTSCGFCSNGLICFHSTTGLPATPFQPDTAYTGSLGSQGSSSRPYYCCIETTRSCPEGTPPGPCSLISVTRCQYKGIVDNSNTGSCSVGTYAEICTQRVVTDDTGATISEFQDFKCDYHCEFPCETHTSLSNAQCDTPPYTGCVPTVANVQCTDQPTACDFGSVAVGYTQTGALQAPTRLGSPVSSVYASDVRQTCVNGQFDCVTECHCFGAQGCPSHSFCNGQGTLYESRSLSAFPKPLGRICMCDPDREGSNCEFAIQTAVGCSRGQATQLQ